MRRRALKRLIVLSISLLAALGLTTGVAGAAEPADQACVGESLSALAEGSQGAFGAGIVGFAQEPESQPGIGDGIQVLQAGLVPDDAVPNTCND
jgi:hypothetical protein